MFNPPTLAEFYHSTLQKNGFTPPEDALAKVAAAQNIDIETAKIANCIFEQLQLDGVPYASHAAMLDDSLKLANAWLDVQKLAAEEATKLTDDIYKVAKTALEGFLTHNRIELDANEALKVAALRAESFNALTTTQAESRQATAKSASMYNSLGSINTQDHTTVNPKAVIAQASSQFGVDPVAAETHIGRLVPQEQQTVFAHGLAQELQSGNHASFPDAVSAAMKRNSNTGAAAAPAKGLMQRPGLLLGAGALGAGALYLMHKKRQEREAANNRMSAISATADMPVA